MSTGQGKAMGPSNFSVEIQDGAVIIFEPSTKITELDLKNGHLENVRRMHIVSPISFFAVLQTEAKNIQYKCSLVPNFEESYDSERTIPLAVQQFESSLTTVFKNFVISQIQDQYEKDGRKHPKTNNKAEKNLLIEYVGLKYSCKVEFHIPK